MVEDKLLERFREEQKAICDSLVQTPASTFDEYKQRVGEWKGLQTAIDSLTEFVRGSEDD